MDSLSNIRIREFDVADYNVTVSLWKEAGLVLRPGDDLDDIRLKLERDPDMFLLAMEGSEVVGCVMGGWDGRRGWIYHLAVRPSHRRQGIAKALIRELEVRLEAKGAKRLNAQVYRSNTASLRFFSECGFEVRSDLVMIGKALRE
ncbi:MAG TPA: GNAT family acetyltransferase [Candidatus Dormibacteraeota bacterium]|nr:GNAT family acetyltransferase [Candidatus Dormibacteraeota bacterium]